MCGFVDRKQLKGTLLLRRYVWGSAFVAQRVGMVYVGPSNVQLGAIRIGSARFEPGCTIPEHNRRSLTARETQRKIRRSYSRGAQAQKKMLRRQASHAAAFYARRMFFSRLGGFPLPLAKTGFITALYIVLVPLFQRGSEAQTGAGNAGSVLHWDRWALFSMHLHLLHLRAR